MADFCRQCSLDHFGQYFGDLSDLGHPKRAEPGMGWTARCEGCGPIVVDDEGHCLSPDCVKKGHSFDGTQGSH
jgi:hypothetical protein